MTNDKRDSINFTEELLLERMPRRLRKDRFTIELETNIKLSKNVIESIIELKSEGYIFAFTLEQMNKLSKENSNNKKLVEITKQDVSLTYSLLNIANSIAYYSRRRIKSLKDVYTRLGMKESKNHLL